MVSSMSIVVYTMYTGCNVVQVQSFIYTSDKGEYITLSKGSNLDMYWSDKQNVRHFTLDKSSG